MQYLEATDSNGTEVYLFQLEDNSFISVPKEQLEFKPLSKEDLDNMLEIMERTSYRCDIWQDRFIYAMAKAIYHISLRMIKEDRNERS